MPKTPPPMLGFNNNVRHHGRVFHIQTEDSGIKRPHIITHLFGDGGRILKSIRTDYSEHVGTPDMPATVKRMMKEQHKGMFVALRAGELDAAIEAAFGPPPPAAAPAPVEPAQPPAEPAPEPAPTPEELAARIATPMPAEWRAPVGPALAPLAPAEPVAVAPGPPRLPTPPPPSHSIGSAVEAMVAKVAGAPVPRSATPLGTPLSQPSPLTRRRSALGAEAPPGRYSISRPPSIFGDAPAAENRSIFGDSLIGEKSLDEVILSYLAEDLDGSSQK